MWLNFIKLTFMSPITVWKSPPSALHSFSITASIFRTNSGGQSRLGESFSLRHLRSRGKATKKTPKTVNKNEQTPGAIKSTTVNKKKTFSSLVRADKQSPVLLWFTVTTSNQKKLRGRKRYLNPPLVSTPPRSFPWLEDSALYSTNRNKK